MRTLLFLGIGAVTSVVSATKRGMKAHAPLRGQIALDNSRLALADVHLQRVDVAIVCQHIRDRGLPLPIAA